MTNGTAYVDNNETIYVVIREDGELVYYGVANNADEACEMIATSCEWDTWYGNLITEQGAMDCGLEAALSVDDAEDEIVGLREYEPTPIHTKAAFRAIRETVGMTQQAFADELGVKVLSVKRWESPDKPQQAPADAWFVLNDALRIQRQVVASAVAKAEESEREVGGRLAVTLPYWTSQEDYDLCNGPYDGGDWRMANANMRMVAFALHERGFTVKWLGGEEYRDMMPSPLGE